MKQAIIDALALVLVAPVLAAPVLAHAASAPDDVARAPASFADLNLNRARDARVMLDRLDRAALEACGASQFSFPDYRASVQKSGCYRSGLDRAVDALNAPQVTRLYQNQPELALASQ